MQRSRDIINLVFNSISKLSDEELDKLINKKSKLVCLDLNNNHRSEEEKTDKEYNLSSDICNKLKLVNSRDEGYEIFNDKNIKKTTVICVAQSMNVHIKKSYTKGKIIDCIIESVVGLRVDRDAIDSVDIK